MYIWHQSNKNNDDEISRFTSPQRGANGYDDETQPSTVCFSSVYIWRRP
jgi:hypothetical protein